MPEPRRVEEPARSRFPGYTPAENARVANGRNSSGCAAPRIRSGSSGRCRASAPGLARRIHETLPVDTLEALEAAAHDGRLQAVPGMGERRSAACRASFEQMLARFRARPVSPATQEPPVAMLLDVDREYRDGARAGSLRTIAPRRFNPAREAWLPVLHTQRGDWHFTALFSNTALAHQLGREHDWVVVYFYDSHHVEQQRTVVTERRGVLEGKRVVRGRESECRLHYGRY